LKANLAKMKKTFIILLAIGMLAATSCIEKSACRKNYKGNKRKGMDLAPGFK
jgi:F0F1-type ATP synthase assembly protein I